MRSNQFHATLTSQLLVKRVTVIGLVTDENIRRFIQKACIKRLFNQLYFMRRSTRNAYGDRKTMSICDCHDLGALAALGLPNAKTRMALT